LRIRSRRALKRIHVGEYRRNQALRREQERWEGLFEVNFETLSLDHTPRYTPPYVLQDGWSPLPENKPDLPFKV
ncbi:unnamed protein product, partial [Choristocarpus tenellus]